MHNRTPNRIRQIILTLVSLSLLFLLAVDQPVTLYYGMIQGTKYRAVVSDTYPFFREFAISDTYAKQVARRLFGSEVVSHMKHRLFNRLATQSVTSYSIRPSVSNTWSGYVANLGNTNLVVNGVEAFFQVSPVIGTHTASWVGIGGQNVGSQSLIQTGVDQLTLQSWYELIPSLPVYLYAVSPGDQMFGGIALDTNTKNWFLIIEDQTTNQTYQSEFSYNVDQSTAEWIVEVDSKGSVPNFNPVNFIGSEWIDLNLTHQPINSSEAPVVDQDFLERPGSIRICPTSLGYNGKSFSVVPC